MTGEQLTLVEVKDAARELGMISKAPIWTSTTPRCSAMSKCMPRSTRWMMIRGFRFAARAGIGSSRPITRSVRGSYGPTSKQPATGHWPANFRILGSHEYCQRSFMISLQGASRFWWWQRRAESVFVGDTTRRRSAS